MRTEKPSDLRGGLIQNIIFIPAPLGSMSGIKCNGLDKSFIHVSCYHDQYEPKIFWYTILDPQVALCNAISEGKPPLSQYELGSGGLCFQRYVSRMTDRTDNFRNQNVSNFSGNYFCSCFKLPWSLWAENIFQIFWIIRTYIRKAVDVIGFIYIIPVILLLLENVIFGPHIWRKLREFGPQIYVIKGNA